MGRAVSARWVEVKEGMMGQIVLLKDKEAGRELEGLVALLKKGASEASVPEAQRGTVADLVKRGLVERKEIKTVSDHDHSGRGRGAKVRRGPGLREADPRDALLDQGDGAGREAQAHRRERERPGSSTRAGGTR